MALRVLGRFCIGLGTLLILFLMYQVVGTNLITGRQQQALAKELQRNWLHTTVAEQKPNLGDGIALIEIPKISVNSVVVEGVEVEDLKKGPGHYPQSALPGQLGNMVISGHRTTYGAPFYRLDELKVGDPIVVINAGGQYKYKVTESKVVLPTQISVIAPSTDARLTLTTCNPRFRATQRLIIVAELDEGQANATAPAGAGTNTKEVPGPS